MATYIENKYCSSRMTKAYGLISLAQLRQTLRGNTKQNNVVVCAIIRRIRLMAKPFWTLAPKAHFGSPTCCL